MPNEFMCLSKVENNLLFHMLMNCGPWEVASSLNEICQYLSKNSEEDGPKPFGCAREGFEFVAELIAAEYAGKEFDAMGSKSAELSEVIDELDEILDYYRKKPFDYHAYLRSPEWKAKRDAQVEAAGSRCQVCNSPERLQCHHRTYERIGNELPEDLFVLCAECHQIFHDNGRLAKR